MFAFQVIYKYREKGWHCYNYSASYCCNCEHWRSVVIFPNCLLVIMSHNKMRIVNCELILVCPGLCYFYELVRTNSLVIHGDWRTETCVWRSKKEDELRGWIRDKEKEKSPVEQINFVWKPFWSSKTENISCKITLI